MMAFSAFDEGGWDVFLIKNPTSMMRPYSNPLPEVEENVDEVVLARKKRESGSTGGSEIDRTASILREEERKDFFPSDIDRIDEQEAGTFSPYEEKLIAFLPDTSSFEFTKYGLRFTPDYLVGGAAFATNIGFAGQTQMAFSDILGDHNIQIAANFFGSIQDSDVFATYWYLKRRTNMGIGLFQYRNNFYLYQPESGVADEIISQTYRGFQLLLSRPFSKFSRLEYGLQGIFISQEVFQQDFFFPDAFPSSGRNSYNYYVPFVSLVTDNVLWGYTGPISGRRGRISYERSLGNDLSYQTVVGDYRHYLNFRQRYILAWRLIGAFSFGNNAQRLRIGGAGTLRGLEFGELAGSKAGVMNLEFRFPLIRVLSLGWPLPLTFREIGGVLFWDMGATWDAFNTFRPFADTDGFFRLNDLKGSYGFGARVNLGYFVLRYDLAQQTDLTQSIGDSRSYFTLGAEY